MSVVCATQEVYDAFYADYKEGKAFVHSHTYAGNPLACSCALAVLKILKRDHIIEKARKTASWLTAEFEKRFLKIENVGEVRHIGLIHAIELVKDRRSKEPFDPSLRLGYRIYRRALSEGLLLRCIGDVLYFNPPLVISQKELEFAQDVTERCVRAELEKL